VGRNRILVVEDEVIIARDVRATLERLGYDVLATIPSGEAAVAAAADMRPDLVLMDIMLRGDMDGIEAAEQIRSRYDIPVVFLTSFADDKTLQRAKITEPFGYILKPFEERELATNIELALYKHEMERQLKDSEDRFRRLTEGIRDGITIIEHGKVIYVNDRAREIFGYPKDALVNMTGFDFAAPEEQERLQRIAAEMGRGGSPPEELRFWIVRGDGSRRYIQNSYSINRKDGDIIGRFVVTADITERQLAEEALQQHNRSLALLNQIGQALTATLDLAQVIEQVLRAVVELADAEGSSVWLWDERGQGELVCHAMLHENQYLSTPGLRVPPGQGIVGWVAEQSESTVVADVRKDPRFFGGIDPQIEFQTNSLLAVPLRTRSGTIGVLEAVNKRGRDGSMEEGPADFTGDQTMVETLAASAAVAIENAQLMERLRQHTAELEASNQELDAFAHSAAHDIKNPLARVVGFAELLEGDYASLPEETLRHSLHRIAQTGRKMSNIVDELLLLSSMRHVEEIDLGPVDMAAIVAEAQDRLDDLIAEHEAEITLPSPGVWPVAMGYGPWIEEVWVNYLSNAIKYGGRPPRIELGATEEQDGMIRFWIRDNGPGLTPEEQARLFTPFTRLDRVRAKGHGLGLSIVRRIVERLGGQVGVDSRVGEGSVFSFILPCVAKEGG
jgi:two-component system sensor histidine kinase/response regulator